MIEMQFVNVREVGVIDVRSAPERLLGVVYKGSALPFELSCLTRAKQHPIFSRHVTRRLSTNTIDIARLATYVLCGLGLSILSSVCEYSNYLLTETCFNNCTNETWFKRLVVDLKFVYVLNTHHTNKCKFSASNPW